MEAYKPMVNVIPVVTLFGGLAGFFTLALTLRFALGNAPAIKAKNEDQPTGA